MGGVLRFIGCVFLGVGCGIIVEIKGGRSIYHVFAVVFFLGMAAVLYRAIFFFPPRF